MKFCLISNHLFGFIFNCGHMMIRLITQLFSSNANISNKLVVKENPSGGGDGDRKKNESNKNVTINDHKLDRSGGKDSDSSVTAIDTSRQERILLLRCYALTS